MDATGLYDDEVIADSEEEDNTLDLQLNENVPVNAQTDLAMQSNVQLPTEPTPVSITPVTTNAQSSKSASNRLSSEPATRPRPKPRPAYKKLAHTGSTGPNPPTDSVLPPQAFTSDNYMDLPSGTSNIADRAKMRSRKTKHKVVDVIELTSDEDEMALLPASKPRAKPKPKHNARPKALNGVSVPDLQNEPYGIGPPANKRSQMLHTIIPNIYATQDTIPVPTSSMHSNDFPIASKLPPSDPPTSTAATYDHPPIVTLPVHDTDIDIPPSSPSSLFSVPSPRKRKRQFIDELDSDRDQDPGSGSQVINPAKSTSSPRNAPPHIPSVEVVDMTMIPATADPKLPSKKTPKPRKPRKKKGEIIVDGEEPETGKPRPKKPKVPKKKLEVVIDGRSKKAGKEKENFKSKEFIEDDDVVDHVPVKIANSSKPESLTSLSSVPDSEDDKQEGPSRQREDTAVEDTQLATGKEKGKAKETDAIPTDPDVRTKKGKGKRVIISDDEDESITIPSRKRGSKAGAADKGKGKALGDVLDAGAYGDHAEKLSGDQNITEERPNFLKENVQLVPLPPSVSLFPSLASRYTIAPRTKSTPMSELIRRVNSLPGSPFSTPRPRASGPSRLKASAPGTAYSPYLKSSKSLLSRIAPLHPNRRTPPPPLPPPPPPKKTKKEREREEQWEEELIESVGGITDWACMTDLERKELRKAKWDREMSGWED